MNTCQEIKDKKIWDDFVTSAPDHTFLHSWNWGEFNEQMGDKIWRMGVYDGDKIIAAALIIRVHARRGNFLFVPHGPLSSENQDPKSVFSELIKKLKELARKESVSFIRISPLLQDSEENRKLFKELGFRPAPIHMHAEITWTLDLAPSEEELIKNMRKTTRNLIRRAERDGVKITISTDESDIEQFMKLYGETSERHSFTPFSSKYLKTQLAVFARDNSIAIFNAWYDNEILASAIVVFYGKSAYYHHGASIPSKIPAAYLLQWEAIKEAKKRGHKYYNFWGIVPENAPKNHPWTGITLFKKGFGGFETDYVHAQDLQLSPMYWVNWAVEIVRRHRRNL